MVIVELEISSLSKSFGPDRTETAMLVLKQVGNVIHPATATVHVPYADVVDMRFGQRFTLAVKE